MTQSRASRGTDETNGLVSANSPPMPTALKRSSRTGVVGAQKTIVQMTATGVRVRRVDIDLDDLMRWCRHEGRPLDSAARAAFAAERLRSGFERADSENV